MKNKRLITLLTVIGVVSLCFIIYSNSINGDFVFDDRVHIIPDGEVKELKEYGEIKNWISLQERPMSFFSFAINKKLHGLNTFGYHLFNIIIHLLASFFVYLFIKKLMGCKHISQLNDHNKILPLAITLIFLVHPIQTQSVSYIIQRMTSLAGLFYLGSAFFYLKGRLSHSNGILKIGILNYLLCVIFFFAAILSKQNAVSLPIVFFIIELFFIRNNKREIYKNYIYVFSGLILAISIFILIGNHLPKETEEISRLSYFITQLGIFTKYLQLMIVPYSLNADYDWALASAIGIKEAFGILIIIGLLITSYKLYNKHRILSFAILWIFITLSVESSFIPIRDLIFEHRLYLPIVGIAIVISYCIIYFIQSKILVTSTLATIIVLFSLHTYSRNFIWQSGQSLWEDVIKKSPNKARPHKMIGNIYFKTGEYQKASYHFNKSIQLNPSDWQGYYNRATLLLYEKKTNKALEDLNQSILLKNDYGDSYESRGMTYMLLNNFEAAEKDFSKAIMLNSKIHSYYLNRAKAYMGLKSFKKAIIDLEKTFRINARFGMAYYLRAKCYYEIKEYAFAQKDLKKAESLGIDIKELLDNLKEKE